MFTGQPVSEMGVSGSKATFSRVLGEEKYSKFVAEESTMTYIIQCSKLRFKFVHPPGAEGGKCLHPEFKSSAQKLRYTLNIWENGAHAGCTSFKIVHPALKSCTQGAGRQGFPSHPWDGENLWLISIGQTSPLPKSYLNTMSSPQIPHIPSLGPYELHSRSFDDSSFLFITDCGFVSHASTKVCQHPIWRPDWFRVKCSEITAGLFNKSMEIHFPLDRI